MIELRRYMPGRTRVLQPIPLYEIWWRDDRPALHGEPSPSDTVIGFITPTVEGLLVTMTEGATVDADQNGPQLVDLRIRRP